MSKVFDKNALLAKFKSCEIPNDLFSGVSTYHREFLFSAQATQPEFVVNKKTSLAPGFVFEEGRRFEKGPPRAKVPNKQTRPSNNPPAEVWRTQDDPMANDFFDDFKGKSDQNKVKEFIIEKKLLLEGNISREVDIVIHTVKKVSTLVNLKTISNRNEIFKEEDTKAAVVTATIQQNETSASPAKPEDQAKVSNNPSLIGMSLFKGSEAYDKNLQEVKAETTEKENTSKPTEDVKTAAKEKEQVKVETKSDPNKPNIEVEKRDTIYKGANPSIFSSDTDLNFSLLYQVNEKLNYPKEDPLWYIYHMVGKSSYGPLSSRELEFLYRTKIVGKDSEVRFIDVFNLIGLKPFEFFKFVDIFNANFISKVTRSGLMSLIDAINNRKSEVVQSIELKKETNTETSNLQQQSDSIYNLASNKPHGDDGRSVNSSNSNNSNNQRSKGKGGNNHYGNNYNNYYNQGNYEQAQDNNQGQGYYQGQHGVKGNYNNQSNDYYQNNSGNYYVNAGVSNNTAKGSHKKIDVNDLFSGDGGFGDSGANTQTSTHPSTQPHIQTGQIQHPQQGSNYGDNPYVFNSLPVNLQQERPKKNKGKKQQDLDVKLGFQNDDDDGVYSSFKAESQSRKPNAGGFNTNYNNSGYNNQSYSKKR